MEGYFIFIRFIAHHLEKNQRASSVEIGSMSSFLALCNSEFLETALTVLNFSHLELIDPSS